MSEPKERPSRLGRGLASLYADQSIEPEQTAARHILSIALLTPGPYQPRQEMAEESLEELTASIAMHGILQPILVRPMPNDAQSFQIIAGERRWRAAQKAGLHEVPVHIRDLDDATALAAALIENLQRQDLNAIEEAEGLRRLMQEFGMTQEVAASSVGKSRSHVANMMRLLSLPTSVQFDVRRGALSAGHARAILGHPDPSTIANTILAKGLNVRQTEALAKAKDRFPARLARPDPSLDTIALERELTTALGMRIKVTSDGKRGQVVLHYDSLDQLDGLIRLLKAE